MHLKGFMLQQLEQHGQMWDYELAEACMREYHLSGDYWYGTIRITLTDLYSSGLLDEVEVTVDSSKSMGKEKILFKFALNDFGRERMAQSGLAGASS